MIESANINHLEQLPGWVKFSEIIQTYLQILKPRHKAFLNQKQLQQLLENSGPPSANFGRQKIVSLLEWCEVNYDNSLSCLENLANFCEFKLGENSPKSFIGFLTWYEYLAITTTGEYDAYEHYVLYEHLQGKTISDILFTLGYRTLSSSQYKPVHEVVRKYEQSTPQIMTEYDLANIYYLEFSPKQRTMISMLLQGKSFLTISDELGISRQYLGELYGSTLDLLGIEDKERKVEPVLSASTFEDIAAYLSTHNNYSDVTRKPLKELFTYNSWEEAVEYYEGKYPLKAVYFHNEGYAHLYLLLNCGLSYKEIANLLGYSEEYISKAIWGLKNLLLELRATPSLGNFVEDWVEWHEHNLTGLDKEIYEFVVENIEDITSQQILDQFSITNSQLRRILIKVKKILQVPSSANLNTMKVHVHFLLPIEKSLLAYLDRLASRYRKLYTKTYILNNFSGCELTYSSLNHYWNRIKYVLELNENMTLEDYLKYRQEA